MCKTIGNAMQNELLLGMWSVYIYIFIYLCVSHVLRATQRHKQLTFGDYINNPINGDGSGMVYYWLDPLIYIINQYCYFYCYQSYLLLLPSSLLLLETQKQ